MTETVKLLERNINSKLNNTFVNKEYDLTQCFGMLVSCTKKDYKNPFYIEKNVNERYACLLNGPKSPGMELVLQY